MDGREAAIALVAAAAGAGAALLALRCSAAPRSDTQRAAGGATIVGVASDPSVESTPAQRAELAALRDQAISPEAAAAAEHDFVQISAEPLDVNAVVAQVVVSQPPPPVPPPAHSGAIRAQARLPNLLVFPPSATLLEGIG